MGIPAGLGLYGESGKSRSSFQGWLHPHSSQGREQPLAWHTGTMRFLRPGACGDVTSTSLAQGWDWQGVLFLQPMLCAVPKLPEESELGKAPCGIMAGVLSGMAVGCSELISAEGSVPSPRVLSLELVLPQQQVLNAVVEEL